MQTGVSEYATLVVGRFIGGIGVGMLSMVSKLMGTRVTRSTWSPRGVSLNLCLPLLSKTFANPVAYHFVGSANVSEPTRRKLTRTMKQFCGSAYRRFNCLPSTESGYSFIPLYEAHTDPPIRLF
jgi:hypothetical protein